MDYAAANRSSLISLAANDDELMTKGNPVGVITNDHLLNLKDRSNFYFFVLGECSLSQKVYVEFWLEI